MNVNQFLEQLKVVGISLLPKQLEQFEKYFEILVEWNDKINLTAITNKEEVYLKHFYDSISTSFFFDFNRNLSIVDVGSGAGFPSLPLKICFPQLDVTIVDSLNKRITFLEHLIKELGLENVHVYHDRAETFGQNSNHREQYDLALARAVAKLNILMELCLPLVKIDGTFMALKGSKGEEELKEAGPAITLLGGESKKATYFELPNNGGERYIILIKKKSKSPKKYPRKPGTPNKDPLL